MENENKKINDKLIDTVAGGGTESMVCPNCGATITVSMEQMISSGYFRCSACGYSICIDPVRSRRDIEDLRKKQKEQMG